MSRRVLAYTVSFGDRPYLASLVPAFRASAGEWFDWAVFLGQPSAELLTQGKALLNDPQRLGIQYLKVWQENRGQHHATRDAFNLARREGYDFVLRIDDDLIPKTGRWLKKLLDRATQLATIAFEEGAPFAFVLCPTIRGLIHPVEPTGLLELPDRNGHLASARELVGYDCEIVPLQGGMRLHPLPLFNSYEPPLYAPIGRGDPDSIVHYLRSVGGHQIRFRDIRVIHDTKRIVSEDTPERTQARKMSHYWPFLESKDV